MEHALEPEVEAVLKADGARERQGRRMRGAGSGRSDQPLDIGDLGLRGFLLVETGATDGVLLGELLGMGEIGSVSGVLEPVQQPIHARSASPPWERSSAQHLPEIRRRTHSRSPPGRAWTRSPPGSRSSCGCRCKPASHRSDVTSVNEAASGLTVRLKNAQIERVDHPNDSSTAGASTKRAVSETLAIVTGDGSSVISPSTKHQPSDQLLEARRRYRFDPTRSESGGPGLRAGPATMQERSMIDPARVYLLASGGCPGVCRSLR
jgi:hypothetical protein